MEAQQTNMFGIEQKQLALSGKCTAINDYITKKRKIAINELTLHLKNQKRKTKPKESSNL